MRALVVLLSAFFAAPVAAQPADGLYEDFPSLFMEPSGPLDVPPTLLPRWADVRTANGVTTVTFEPDARVSWRITWGPSGPTEKITLVDGEEWTRSTFTYDARGQLATKDVTGHGVLAPQTHAYTTDARGRITRRTTMPLSGVPERLDVAYRGHETVATLRDGRRIARRDRYDAQRRLLETQFFDENGRLGARLTYVRAADGSLLSVRRRIGAHRGSANLQHVDPTVVLQDVSRIAVATMERHEVLLLLGPPTRSEDTGRGVARRMSSDYAPGCWLNQTSGRTYDATGRAIGGTTGCICGFCVASSAIDPSERARATGIQEHWTRGPWVRLDDAIDVTADHELVTPAGPRAAGSLHAGDVVTAADGSSHVLRSVVPLADALALGVNLETPDQSFSAGGLRFVTEAPRACTPE